MGSDWDTARQNLTFPFVYSWPGWRESAIFQGYSTDQTYVDLGVIREISEDFIESVMHLLGVSFEEASASCECRVRRLEKSRRLNFNPSRYLR